MVAVHHRVRQCGSGRATTSRLTRAAGQSIPFGLTHGPVNRPVAHYNSTEEEGTMTRTRKKLLITTALAVTLAVIALVFLPTNTRTGEKRIPNVVATYSPGSGVILVNPDNSLCGDVGRVLPDGTEEIWGAYKLVGKDYLNASEAEKAADVAAAMNRIIDKQNTKIAKNQGGFADGGIVSVAHADWTFECPECGGGDCCSFHGIPGNQLGPYACTACQQPYNCTSQRLCCSGGTPGSACGACTMFGCWQVPP